MEKIQRRIKGVIIGCGKISGYFDEKIKYDKSSIYSYSSAIFSSDFLKIEGCVDINEKKAKKISDLFNIPFYFKDYSEALKALKPEFVIIATPDQTHFEITKQILISSNCPKLIVVEKPICFSLLEFQELKQLMNLKETQIIINHSRRFNNRFKNLKQKIKNQIFGNPFRLDIYTYGEWKKNGIHIIDTLVYLFDSQIIINEIKIEKTKTKIKTSEWTDILLRISDLFIVNINYVPEKYYQLFEMDFKFENARINFQDFEQRVFVEKKTTNQLKENILELSKNTLGDQKSSNMANLIEEIEHFFQNKTSLEEYSINSIEKSMKLYFKIIPYYEN